MSDHEAASGQRETAETIRVVIVDDHQIFRTGLRAELGAQLDVVGEAATVHEALEVIAATVPNVVLLDVHLPGGEGGGGAEVLRRIATLARSGQAPAGLAAVRFLALSVSDAADDVVSVIRAGA